MTARPLFVGVALVGAVVAALVYAAAVMGAPRTDVEQMAAELQASFERERELEASRRDLIAAVSHDLRTPLATTRAMVEAMLDGVVTDPGEVRRYLELMRGEVQHLSRLIDDLFELSQ